MLHDIRRNVPFETALRRALTGLDGADRALAHEVAAGVLRHRTALDAALTPHLAAGTGGVRPDLLDILRVGAYQLLFLERVPRHAAVDTAVSLGRRVAGSQVGGFINAVLRKVAPGAATPAGGGDATDPEALALRYSHPAWLVARWVAGFGPEEAERLLRVNNERPDLVIQPARWPEDALLAGLDQHGIKWGRAPFGAGIVVEGVRPAELPGFGAGSCYVQDPAQQLVMRYFGIDPAATVYDACAAPGGKSLALGPGPGWVLAADLRAARARRLRENLDRAGTRPAAVLVADTRRPPVRLLPAVVLDAPCLGTGTFARHPDARWRVTPEALRGLAAQAASFLDALAGAVAPGGMLFFSTCSLEPEENDLQIEAFLARDRRFRREPSSTVPAELLSGAGDLVVLPQRHGSDGAYAARLRRVA